LESTRGRWDDPVDVKLHLDIWPRDLTKRVNAAVKKIEEQYAIEKINLNKRFVDLREQLVTMSLDGDAKDFLAKIPTVDEILPLPNGNGAELRQLVAA
jgi:hypothetical protein